MSFFFAHRLPFLFQPRVFSRHLGCGACRGPACTQGARLGPGRALWRLLWPFNVAKTRKESRCRFPSSQRQPGPLRRRTCPSIFYLGFFSRSTATAAFSASCVSLSDFHTRCLCMCVSVRVCAFVMYGRRYQEQNI